MEEDPDVPPFLRYHILRNGQSDLYLTTNPDQKHFNDPVGPSYYIRILTANAETSNAVPSDSRTKSEISRRISNGDVDTDSSFSIVVLVHDYDNSKSATFSRLEDSTGMIDNGSLIPIIHVQRFDGESKISLRILDDNGSLEWQGSIELHSDPYNGRDWFVFVDPWDKRWNLVGREHIRCESQRDPMAVSSLENKFLSGPKVGWLTLQRPALKMLDLMVAIHIAVYLFWKVETKPSKLTKVASGFPETTNLSPIKPNKAEKPEKLAKPQKKREGFMINFNNKNTAPLFKPVEDISNDRNEQENRDETEVQNEVKFTPVLSNSSLESKIPDVPILISTPKIVLLNDSKNVQVHQNDYKLVKPGLNIESSAKPLVIDSTFPDIFIESLPTPREDIDIKEFRALSYEDHISTPVDNFLDRRETELREMIAAENEKQLRADEKRMKQENLEAYDGKKDEILKNEWKKQPEELLWHNTHEPELKQGQENQLKRANKLSRKHHSQIVMSDKFQDHKTSSEVVQKDRPVSMLYSSFSHIPQLPQSVSQEAPHLYGPDTPQQFSTQRSSYAQQQQGHGPTRSHQNTTNFVNQDTRIKPGPSINARGGISRSNKLTRRPGISSKVEEENNKKKNRQSVLGFFTKH
ncbi:hypothetical protein V1514DRAFT_319117 [Lipomyces japonicus]|uniref:uncharacterized protein n=1 Tax=Lipomyces japonicus TaxID=56871 RepID=UPI0034CD15B4